MWKRALVGMALVGCAPSLGVPRLDDEGNVRCYDGDTVTSARAVCGTAIVVEAGDSLGCSAPVASDVDCASGLFCTRYPDECSGPAFCAVTSDRVRSLSDCDSWIAACQELGATTCAVEIDASGNAGAVRPL